ncbi:hypothetical protein HMSSN139_47660 [Paenibacillus sp. HMSSN-139]|nr:hypothetical protein HMSSN139_47660 [Paenibacillus sp. HMSSN-139]
MSREQTEKKRGFGGPRRGHGGPGGPGMGMPVEKAKDFKGTLKRLIRYLRPHKVQLAAVLVMAILSTVFSIFSPKVMGKATTKLFEGIVAKIQGVPGAEIDFQYVWQIIMILIGLYVLSALFGYVQQYLMAGVAQKTVYDLRKDVNAKLNKLPLKYFDARTHGEILSRVTNDVDNIAGTLQQSLTQLITSILTIIGVIAMMLSISPLMTLIAVLTLPLSIVAITSIAKRSQKQFVRQQKELGQLNGHVEEMYTGHKIIKAFGRETKSLEEFDNINERLYEAGWKAQFISGVIMPIMSFIGNIGYVLVSVVGGILVTKRTIEIGDVQAFIQYSRQFTMPITQTANIANIIQSTVASAERVFEILDEEEQVPETANPAVLERPRGDVAFNHVQFGYDPEHLLIEDMNIDVKQGQTIAIVGPTAPAKRR